MVILGTEQDICKWLMVPYSITELSIMIRNLWSTFNQWYMGYHV